MAKKKKLYLDTSVPGAYYDDRSPEQRDITRAFWQRLDKYDLYTSTLVKDEIERLGEVYSREIHQLTMMLINHHTVLSITDKTEQLAEIYLRNRVVPASQISDALHLAIASTNRIDYLVSWNFRHLVRQSTRQGVKLINQGQGYPSFDIVAPSEFLEGGNLYEEA